MCSIIGVGERLHKVLGQIDLGTLDSGERSLPFGLLVCFGMSFVSSANLPSYFRGNPGNRRDLRLVLDRMCLSAES